MAAKRMAEHSTDSQSREARSNIAFYDLLADQYDLFFLDPRQNMEDEGNWLGQLLGWEGATRILDASCGCGRQAVPLLQRGFDIVAGDPSEPMLRRARERASALGLQLRTVRAEFIQLPDLFSAEFHAIVTMGNGLCNVDTPEGIGRALSAMRRCLAPRGVCIVGIKDFDRIRQERIRFHGHRIADETGTRTILFEVWDFEDPILVSTAFVLRGSKTETAGWSAISAQTREYMLGAAELETLARAAGFRSIERLPRAEEASFLLR